MHRQTQYLLLQWGFSGASSTTVNAPNWVPGRRDWSPSITTSYHGEGVSILTHGMSISEQTGGVSRKCSERSGGKDSCRYMGRGGGGVAAQPPGGSGLDLRSSAARQPHLSAALCIAASALSLCITTITDTHTDTRTAKSLKSLSMEIL
jgi:hypothetical protein